MNRFLYKRNVLLISIVYLNFYVTVCLALPPGAESAQLIGSAFDPGSNELLYKEYHHWLGGGKEHRVYYRGADGSLWAEKKITYLIENRAPSIWQINNVSGEALQVQHVADNHIEVDYRADAAAVSKKKTLATSDQLVIDAGFDHFIREHWNQLVDGKILTFDYLVPSRQAIYLFAVEKADCEKIRAEGLCLQIRPVSWWMKLLVDPIYLSYDREERRLLRFVGLGNLSNTSGKYLSVDIRYDYLADFKNPSPPIPSSD